MNLLDDLNIETSGLQSNWHGLIRNSFVYLSGGTMRLAGDDLVLELFREIFFDIFGAFCSDLYYSAQLFIKKNI